MTCIIGLTGGIGSGKSTASAAFLGAGIPVIDADRLSRELTGPKGEGSEAVALVFGEEYLTADRAMDRARMRDLVFKNPTALKKLEGVLHPLIAKRVEEEARKYAESPLVIYDCPLLYRSTLRPLSLSRILVIDAPDAMRLSRIMTRPGITEETARRMMRAQPSRTTFLSLADDIILNADTPEALELAVRRYLDRLSFPAYTD